MRVPSFKNSLAGAIVVCILSPAPGIAEESASDLAKHLSNPVADLISVPFELNYDDHIGPADGGRRFLMNVQPVIPFSLNDTWNVVSRTILPIESQHDIFPGAGGQSGLGDTLQSFFLSPKAPTAGGWIWGAGPVLLLRTGTDSLLSSEKWGVGPTAVALRQVGPWTYGVLANQIWSFAGDRTRTKVNATFLQPFLSYTTPEAWTYSVDTQTTYDWAARKASVPINLGVSKVMKVGTQLVSIGGELRYWAASPTAGSKDLGVRLTITLLFPKK